MNKKIHIRTDETLIYLCMILIPKRKKTKPIYKSHKSRSNACFGRLDLGKGWAIAYGSNHMIEAIGLHQLFLKNNGIDA